MTNCNVITSPERNQAGTPLSVFNELNNEYHFTVDVAASDLNFKLPYYFTKQGQSGLCHNWTQERVWCNPPYADIDPWLYKATTAKFAALLLPARTFNDWWYKYKPLAECHYFIGRMQFEAPEGIKYSSNPFPVVLLLFGEGCTPGLEKYRDAKTGKYLKE